MNNSIKILLGSTLNKLNNVKKTGKICFPELYILNLISKFLPNCNKEIEGKLKKLYRDIQTSNSYICKIRNTPNNYTFKFKNININNFFGEMANFNINITGQTNLPPTDVGDGSKTTAHATTSVFLRVDFTTNTVPPYADPEGDIAQLLKILSLPSGGDLKLNGTNVVLNQVIDFSDIDAGLFTYDPEPTSTTTRVEPFSFAIADAGSLSFTS